MNQDAVSYVDKIAADTLRVENGSRLHTSPRNPNRTLSLPPDQ
ncbi:hypothetical protein [Alloacidobacterium dinghuense]|nr:hypothetical protein [Alloacidobacterium dinghuense]